MEGGDEEGAVDCFWGEGRETDELRGGESAAVEEDGDDFL